MACAPFLLKRGEGIWGGMGSDPARRGEWIRVAWARFSSIGEVEIWLAGGPFPN